jgi:citrate lyase beta subunit
MLRTSLDGAIIADVAARLSTVDDQRARRYPGDAAGRQPVHTCYVPADRVTPELPAEWGAGALAALDEHAPTPPLLARALDLPEERAATVLERVRAKLEREPVEDLRIDFEDGYGARDDRTEDEHAQRAAAVLAGWHRSGAAPPWAGIRFKSFHTTALLERGARTLDIFLTTLGRMPSGLVLTFPKVTVPEQVRSLVELLELLEDRLGIPSAGLRFEIQIETTQSIVDSDGRIAIPRLIAAGRGRVSALHFGTYDYTAACGLGAAHQHLAHGSCDFARHVMQVAAAGTGVRLSDGSLNVLPVGDADAVYRGWRAHYGLVRRSLEHGFYQGWDLHPAQLVTRYAAVYAYYLDNAEAEARRLGAYLSGTAGSIADEPATARALAGTLRRAVDCGALTRAEADGLVGRPDWGAHA